MLKLWYNFIYHYHICWTSNTNRVTNEEFQEYTVLSLNAWGAQLLGGKSQVYFLPLRDATRKYGFLAGGMDKWLLKSVPMKLYNINQYGLLYGEVSASWLSPRPLQQCYVNDDEAVLGEEHANNYIMCGLHCMHLHTAKATGEKAWVPNTCTLFLHWFKQA